jgi:hypothetical protein
MIMKIQTGGSGWRGTWAHDLNTWTWRSLRRRWALWLFLRSSRKLGTKKTFRYDIPEHFNCRCVVTPMDELTDPESDGNGGSGERPISAVHHAETTSRGRCPMLASDFCRNS